MQQQQQPSPSPSPHIPANSDLTSALSLAASAISLSLHHLSHSDSDLLLPLSQTLTLESSLHSSALSLARLLSLLHLPPQTLTLTPLPSPLPRPSWFLRLLSSSPSLFPPHFRMSKPSFFLLLQTLSPSLNGDGTVPVPPDHKLGAALLRLAHAAPFPLVARCFGLPSPDLACRAFYEVCRAVADRLAHLFELASGLPRVLQGFHWMSLPNCCGALGFARFRQAVLAQALVDSEGRFLDVSAGWLASMPPADVLPRTRLYASQSVVLAAGPPLQLGGAGSTVPRYFLGGACCPLLPWLLTPYNGRGGEGAAAVYDAVHARGMELVGRAFGRLKGRWRLLGGGGRGDECAEALPFVIVAACLLHNYLIKCSEPVCEMGAEAEEGFGVFEGEGDEEGERVRSVLAAHLAKVINP